MRPRMTFSTACERRSASRRPRSSPSGRRLVGGLLGRVGGSLVGRLGSTATGSAFSFATTWALGQVAERYYAGGRTLDAQRLKESFGSLLGEARTLESRYLPEIRERARTIDPAAVLDLCVMDR